MSTEIIAPPAAAQSTTRTRTTTTTTTTTHDDHNDNDNDNNELPSDISTFLQPTTTPLSSQRLAQTLGYPSTWHVVRTTNKNNKSFTDRIYAGPPSSNPDTYYNHCAAMTAALKWIEGKSTPHDDDGGQLNPREAQFEKDEYVEVLYEPDGCWYAASIVKVVIYQDDIRYTVLYKQDGTKQTNVSEDLIRKAVKPKPKKRKKSIETTTTTTTPSTSVSTTKKKQKASAAAALSSNKSKKKTTDIVDQEESSNTEKNKITSYFTAAESTAASSLSDHPKHKIHRGRSTKKSSSDDDDEDNDDHQHEDDYDEEHTETLPPQKTTEAEEEDDYGDPPWRTTNHKYLHRQIQYKHQLPSSQTITQFGTVTGWISPKDKDRDGNPGFISEITNKPAALFHVVFGGDYECDDDLGADFKVEKDVMLQSQDLEEYEVVECLVDGRKKKKRKSSVGGGGGKKKRVGKKEEVEKEEEEEEEQDEDDVPLSSIIRLKEKEASAKKKRGRPRRKK